MTPPFNPAPPPVALPNRSDPAGSATRHAVTGILASVLTSYAMRRGLPVDPAVGGAVASEISNWVVGIGVAVGTAASAGVGALWRRFVG